MYTPAPPSLLRVSGVGVLVSGGKGGIEGSGVWVGVEGWVLVEIQKLKSRQGGDSETADVTCHFIRGRNH